MTKKSSQTALLWIVAAGFFMQTLDTTIVNTALPSVAMSLHESPLAMRSIVVAYTLAMALIMPASGWLADRFGTRRVYLTAILIFVLGSICCSSALTLNQLVFARVLQGIGGSMLVPIGRLAVLRRMSGEQFVSAIATVAIAGQAGPIVGPTLGGWFAEVPSWHWIFLVNLPIGALGLAAASRYLPREVTGKAPPFDMLGCALLSLAVIAFSLATDAPLDNHRVVWSAGFLIFGLVVTVGYVVHAKHRINPIFSLKLFHARNYIVGLVRNLVSRIGSSAVPSYCHC